MSEDLKHTCTVASFSCRACRRGLPRLAPGPSPYDLSDVDLATAVRMLGRNDIIFEPTLTAARDRIVLLSKRATEAEVNFAAVAHAAGIEHVPDRGDSWPGSVDEVVKGIDELRRDQDALIDLRREARALTDEEAVMLRRNLPGSPRVEVDGEREMHRHLVQRGFLDEEITPLPDGMEGVHMVTSPIGVEALDAYDAHEESKTS